MYAKAPLLHEAALFHFDPVVLTGVRGTVRSVCLFLLFPFSAFPPVFFPVIVRDQVNRRDCRADRKSGEYGLAHFARHERHVFIELVDDKEGQCHGGKNNGQVRYDLLHPACSASALSGSLR